MTDKDELYKRAVELNAKLVEAEAEKPRPIKTSDKPYWQSMGKMLDDKIVFNDEQELIARSLYENRFRPQPRMLQDAILLFGPCHGLTVRIQEGAKQFDAVSREDSAPRFEPYEFGNPMPSTRGQMHMYRYDQMYSSMNGEDCVVLVHDENCCDKTIPKSKR